MLPHRERSALVATQVGRCGYVSGVRMARRVVGRVMRARGRAALVALATVLACAAPHALVARGVPASVTENALPGAPRTEWDVNAAGDPSLQGFARAQSYAQGEVARIAARALGDFEWRADVYRLGYYSGEGARHVLTLRPTAAQAEASRAQPECVLVEPATLLFDCANWATSLEFVVPNDATSGLYVARLVRTGSGDDNGGWRADDVGLDTSATPQFAKAGAAAGTDPRPANSTHSYGAAGHGDLRDKLREPRASHVWFVVRAADTDPDSAGRGTERAAERKRNGVLVQTADTTWQAYNRWGGSGLYGGVGVGHGPKDYGGGGLDPDAPARRSFKVSYNRPLVTRDYRSINMPLGAELPGIMWLERNGYDVEYVSAGDVDRLGAALLGQYAVFLSLGHDEYSTQRQFEALQRARAHNATSLFFWSANEYFWRVRWEADPAGEARRVMVCYKDTQADVKLDPLPGEWTGTFRDARPQNPLGSQPENILSGTIFTVNAWRNDALEVPSEMAALRFWRHSDMFERARGSGTAYLPRGVLGHEWDEDVCNGARPACIAHLSRTQVDGVMYVQDHGSVYDTGSATHRMVAFRHPKSGALTWGTGTVQWSWGLSPLHDGGAEGGVPPERANPFNTRVRRDVVGTDVAAQQLSVNMFVDAGVTAHTLQRELTPPARSTDTSPPRSRVSSQSHDAIYVLARDVGGGRVAGVELSFDGGSSWHFAERAAHAYAGETGGGEGAADSQRAAASAASGADELFVLRRRVGTRWHPGAPLLVRAVDDSLNCETAHAGSDEMLVRDASEL